MPGNGCHNRCRVRVQGLAKTRFVISCPVMHGTDDLCMVPLLPLDSSISACVDAAVAADCCTAAQQP